MPTTDDYDKFDEQYREDVEYVSAAEFLEVILNCGGILVLAIILTALFIVLGR